MPCSEGMMTSSSLFASGPPVFSFVVLSLSLRLVVPRLDGGAVSCNCWLASKCLWCRRLKPIGFPWQNCVKDPSVILCLWVSCCARVTRLVKEAMLLLPCVCKNKWTNLNFWCSLSFSLCWLWSYEYVNGYMRHLKYIMTCEYIWCECIFIWLYICICFHMSVFSLHMLWHHFNGWISFYVVFYMSEVGG